MLRTGDVVLAGHGVGPAGFTDIVTICYSGAGDAVWVSRLDSANGKSEFAGGIAADSSGNVYVTGYGSQEGVCVTAKYAPGGKKLWEAGYSGGGSARPVAISVGADGRVFVTGTLNIGSETRIFALCYGESPTTTITDAGRVPSRMQLLQNYPNPFNPTTTIKYELPKSSLVRLSVYDLLGREVYVLVNERRDAGVHEVKFDAADFSSGVYLYRLQAGDFVQVRKLLLLK